MQHHARLTIAALAGLLLTALLGCQPAPPPASPAASAGTPVSTVAAPSATAPEPVGNLRVAWVAASAGYLPLWVAQDRGLFEKRGLTTELVFTSGPGAVQSLLARELEIAYTDGSAIVQAALAGGDTVMLGSTTLVFPFKLIAQPALQSIDDLRGKRLGIARTGSSTDFAARYLLRSKGLVPDTDVALVQTVSTPERFQAMVAGGIDAGLYTEPVGYEARKQGYAFLFDLATMGTEYPTTGIGTLRSILAERPASLRAFITGLTEATAWIKQNRAEALDILAHYTQIEDPQALAAAYDEQAPRFPDAPYVTEASVATILESIRDTEPRGATARPADFIDNRFVRELDDSGFIRQLYP
ncbi:MAG TPA: ABC transporter substrate-binding protein [Chloroflexota bacterium]|jgi:NitT/TauT family transport system substrate-binding protein